MKNNEQNNVTGQFVTFDDERYYKIEHVDKMAPFFISLISSSDHWLFASSNGGLTAGRVSPETALFPYVTVDKIHESTSHTGCKTIVLITDGGQTTSWEPFNYLREQRFELSRHLYKSTLGDKLCFEEVNHTLGLRFSYVWTTSDDYGFSRQVKIENLQSQARQIEVLDGLINVLPAGTPRFTQAQSSNLVDAYKFNELDESTGVGIYSLYSGITDRAEPSESLRANTIFVLGLDVQNVLLSERQLPTFKAGQPIETESSCRGIRGAYLVSSKLELDPNGANQWQIVANIEQDQSQITDLLEQLNKPLELQQKLTDNVAQGSQMLANIMASSDGFQVTEDEALDVHHYANTLFNVLRGGIFNDQYSISATDFKQTLKGFNASVYQRNKDFLAGLPESLSVQSLQAQVEAQNDPQLARLALEYLPITFGRRHGDPSRPWNQFAIKLRDSQGNPLLSYQGNWRDIFQNWEALTFSYPLFIESVIAKFVNASTMDGYNPYRITKEGIDWEVEEPDDPWSYIGYWGDHQIIYLLKMLELSQQFHPQKLSDLLHQPLFCYANVPYRIKPFEDLVKDAKSTVDYDQALADEIEKRVEHMGADGKLVLTQDGQVYQVNLLEKLLVPLLAKLSNFVVDGGIWLNTQRPEWNDANNALVGQGLSMVTLYYMRRYVHFMQSLLASQSQDVELSVEVSDWLVATSTILSDTVKQLEQQELSDEIRFEIVSKLGRAGSDYRQQVYANEGFSDKTTQPISTLTKLLDSAMQCIDRSIEHNHQSNGLYHAYNLLSLRDQKARVANLYPMLEGQVAALSSGAVTGNKAIDVVEALFNSDIYRADQDTFMLYPDRKQVAFLDKNTVSLSALNSAPVLNQMIIKQDNRLIQKDSRGVLRFNADIKNAGDLERLIDTLCTEYGNELSQQAQQILDIYESVFNHQAFTGRSGGMFGFEGLGSIYWHMVSKLLLAVNEQFFHAVENELDQEVQQRLGDLYYRVRHGIGFNKTPEQYGAFPTDPYSHTPKHAGAQQPGMTGQVKEEVLSRFAELGVRVVEGQVRLCPALLRQCEFTQTPRDFDYLDVHNQWQKLALAGSSIGFTWCQIPFVYRLTDDSQPRLTITFADGQQFTSDSLVLTKEHSQSVFNRTGQIVRIDATINASMLFNGSV
ncbi:hypothetical protein [Aliiglaciecola litoralis]